MHSLGHAAAGRPPREDRAIVHPDDISATMISHLQPGCDKSSLAWDHLQLRCRGEAAGILLLAQSAGAPVPRLGFSISPTHTGIEDVTLFGIVFRGSLRAACFGEPLLSVCMDFKLSNPGFESVAWTVYWLR
jgi:hypothetical protein